METGIRKLVGQKVHFFMAIQLFLCMISPKLFVNHKVFWLADLFPIPSKSNVSFATMLKSSERKLANDSIMIFIHLYA